MSRSVRRVCVLVFALLLTTGVVVVVLHFRPEPQPMRDPPTVSCSVRLLSPDERRQHLHAAQTHPGSTLRSLPDKLADNPMVFFSDHAVVRIENTTPAPLHVHALTGTCVPSTPGGVFRLDVALFDANEQKLSLTPEEEWDRISVLSDNPPSVPTTDELSQRKQPMTYELPAHTAIELPVDILSHWSNPRYGLKPGTYTARVTVSFAESPSGTARHIVCEPVTVTVTEEQIKAAKAYWDGPK